MTERKVQLWDLPAVLNDVVYTSEKYPFLIDPTGQACNFLRYRSRYLTAFKKGDFEKESLRKGLVQALHNGAWLVLDFAQLDISLTELFVEGYFPEAVLSPHELFKEEIWKPLLRPTDEFSAKVTYEHSAAAAVGQFQDRTVAHAPERLADVNREFDPKDAFRLIITSTKEGGEVPDGVKDRMLVLKVACDPKVANDKSVGVWGGGERPTEKRTPAQLKLDNELLEVAFDGEADAVKELLEKGAEATVKDGRGATPLSEAAVKGHLETVRIFLDWKAPLGSDPNSQGNDKRTPLHRAAFGGFLETVRFLLERGSDPRLKDLQSDKPFDLASNDETRTLLDAWDVAITDRLKDERQKAQDIEDEKSVKNAEDRLRLDKQRKMAKLSGFIEKGDKDGLEDELNDIAGNIEAYRDDRGNTVLHLAAVHGKVEIIICLIKDHGCGVNPRDAKGWTPIAVAGFHGHKKACQELMALGADVLIENAYRKSALDVAKDDEIRGVLQSEVGVVGGKLGDADASAEASSSEAPAAKAKGKAKAKAKADGPAPKAKAAGGAQARGTSTGAKAKAKGKAKAK